MRTKDILMAVIEHLSVFEAQNPKAENLTLADFVGYLNGQVDAPNITEREEAGDKAPQWIMEMGEETHSIIARLVIIMNRYAKSYIKRALDGSRIQTGEEFSYLIILLTFDSLTKTELINKNIMEKTSGTEVIKRLLNLGFIKEFDDQEDKRSKRISITNEGKTELYKILPKMHEVTSLVAGNLNQHERATLAYLLKKLDHHHHDIFTNDRSSSFEELSSKYLKK